jgi:hypothetical protein
VNLGRNVSSPYRTQRRPNRPCDLNRWIPAQEAEARSASAASGSTRAARCGPTGASSRIRTLGPPGHRIFNRDRSDEPSSSPTYYLSVSCQTPSQSVGRDARYPELPQHAEPPPLSYTPSAAPASSSTGSSCSGSRPARQRRWARSPTNGAGARVTRGDGRHEHVAGTDRRRDCSRPRVRRRRVIGGIAPETGQKPETTAFGQ